MTYSLAFRSAVAQAIVGCSASDVNITSVHPASAAARATGHLRRLQSVDSSGLVVMYTVRMSEAAVVNATAELTAAVETREIPGSNS